MKEVYEKLDLGVGVWWIVLIIMFVVVPIYKVDTMVIPCGEEVIDKDWWMYVFGIFVFDFVLIVLLIAVSLMGMILAKLHNFLTKEE